MLIANVNVIDIFTTLIIQCRDVLLERTEVYMKRSLLGNLYLGTKFVHLTEKEIPVIIITGH